MGLSSAIGIALSFLCGLWIPATLLCCVPWVQKRRCTRLASVPALTLYRDAIFALGDLLPREMAD